MKPFSHHLMVAASLWLVVKTWPLSLWHHQAPLGADAFSLLSQQRVGTTTPWRGSGIPRTATRTTMIWMASTTTVEPEGTPKAVTEAPPVKLTKEAQELWQVFEAVQHQRQQNQPEPQGQDKAPPALVLAQVAPSVRVAFSEEFGLGPGAFSPGILVASLKELGFDLVLDTNTAADLTICEEGTELLHRVQARIQTQMEKKKQQAASPSAGPDVQQDSPADHFPLFTSCCPGWMSCVEKMAPDLVQHISTCKSPHMMYGALMKEYSQELLGQPLDKIYFTSVMPCVRKRGESDHAAFVRDDGVRDVDNVITTQDLGQLLKMKGIDPAKLQPVPFDSPFQTDGTGTGAGQLFGATGGVMEAAVRTVYEVVTGKQLPRLELEEVRGLDGVKEAVIPLYAEDSTGLDEPLDLRVAVVNGLGNAKKLVQKMRDGTAQYDFVEVMACPGGCIGGGGQPKGEAGALEKRLECIYNLDRSLPLRRSHENPTVQTFYERFLGEYGSEKAHELLHVEPVYGESKSNPDGGSKAGCEMG